jgi:hypothetical protein
LGERGGSKTCELGWVMAGKGRERWGVGFGRVEDTKLIQRSRLYGNLNGCRLLVTQSLEFKL